MSYRYGVLAKQVDTALRSDGPEAAERLLAAAPPKALQSPEIIYCMSTIAEMEGNLHLQREHLVRCIRADEEYLPAWVGLALCHKKLGELLLAGFCTDTALEFYSSSWSRTHKPHQRFHGVLHTLRAEIHLADDRDLEAAKANLAMALVYYPGYDLAERLLSRLGECLGSR